MIAIWVRFIMQVQKFVPPKKLGAKNIKIRLDFRQLQTSIANISGTGKDIQNRKRIDRERVQRRKSDELWFTNYRQLDVSMDPPKLNFSGNYISAGAGPSNFNTH